MSFIKKAREAFDAYCSMGAGQVPPPPHRLQVLLHRMYVHDGYTGTSSVLEAMSAVGVMASAINRPLAHETNQRELVARLVVRLAVHLVNLCTVYRLDFFTLVEEGLNEDLKGL